MTILTFPFLSSYDPSGTSEGTLDPLGLYQIADQLATELVPAVRERMVRIRFLTAMAVGTLVAEGLRAEDRHRDAEPYLVWEWLVVEALIRSFEDNPNVRGIPGTMVTTRALRQHNYIDARSYLKTPRIFGFNGVYKRLAIHFGITDVHLGPGPKTEELVDAWAKSVGLGSLAGAKETIDEWRDSLERSLRENPPRTRPRFRTEGWKDLADKLAPWECRGPEKRYLRDLLLDSTDSRMGALPAIWKLQGEFPEDDYHGEQLHHRLEQSEPRYAQLLIAIRAYERFARSLQDAFDILKAEGSRSDGGYRVPDIARDAEFAECVRDLHVKAETACQAIGEIKITSLSIQNFFRERFGDFLEPMDAGSCALALCTHHEMVQRGKSAGGKRSWFDRLGPDRIYVRHAYRSKRPEVQPERYLHAYRSSPIRRFWRDLS